MKILSKIIGLALITSLLLSAAQAQTLGQGAKFEVPTTRLVFGFIFCVLLAYATARLIRYFQASKIEKNMPGLLNIGSSHKTQRIHVKETRRLTQNADICRVQCDNVEYLLVISSNGIQVLKEAPIVEDKALLRAVE